MMLLKSVPEVGRAGAGSKWPVINLIDVIRAAECSMNNYETFVPPHQIEFRLRGGLDECCPHAIIKPYFDSDLVQPRL